MRLGHFSQDIIGSDVTDAPMAEVVEAPPPHPRPTWPTWVEILLCSGFPTQLVINFALLGAGLPALGPDGQPSGTFVFTLLLLDTIVLLSLIVLFIRRRGQRARDVFFGRTRPLSEVITGVVSLPTVIVIVIGWTVLVRQFVPSLHNVPDNPIEGLVSGHNVWLFLIVAIVAGGVREELQRAFLLQRFRDDFGQPWVGLLITSLAFGMGHLIQGRDAALITGTLGAFWGFMYFARGGALASIISHSLFNSAELLQIFIAGG
jgi:membrane protease YdiL (CAAX protease family)